MALWMVRSGRHGEFEQKFLEENRVYLTWNRLRHNLNDVTDRNDLRTILAEVYPKASAGRIRNSLGQVWAFSQKIKKGDLIALPSKQKPAIHIGEVVGDYEYNANAEDPFYHSMAVKWLQLDIPRSNFDQDLLYSLGALMTVCQIKRNDAENRLHKMAKKNWVPTAAGDEGGDSGGDFDDLGGDKEFLDLEQIARDQIAKMIIAKFKGHGMEILVNAILVAQGYTTYVSPRGPDKGIDILAAPAPMGFGEPRICIQVKSGDSPLDRPTLDQLIGAMQNINAQNGLLVSWGGFKASVDKEKVNQFFRVRLWDQDDLIDNLMDNYDKLDDEIRAEISLKRIWTPTAIDAGDE